MNRSFDRESLRENDYISQLTAAIYDYEFIKALKEIPWAEWVGTPKAFRIREEYLDRYHSWILSSQMNRIRGLDKFPVRHLINGTTQTFDEAYYIHKERRLRFFRGEYAYHRRVFPNWKFLEDEPVSRGDFLIVSAPFCSSGEVHTEMGRVLDDAYAVGAPVLVDCAYFGTCLDLDLNLDHPSIESVSFSLTKGVGMGDIRSGIRYSRVDDGGPIAQQNHYNHSVLCAAKMGLHMMNRFSPDHIPGKFRAAQLMACELLGITPTKVMHLALGNENWPEFRVDGAYFRVGIRNLVKAVYTGEIRELP